MSETTNKQFLDKNGLVAFWNKIMSTVTNIITSKLEEYLSTIDVDLSMHIAWSDLVALRNNSQLTPGKKYRIIDYVTTTAQSNTRSAGHQFDIIVTADDEKTLNEAARACLHEGDTYFANSDLNAWELKYCLDNDVERFAWADTDNGTGVIYRMIDEWGNDCPYDFKNIVYIFNKSFLYNQWGKTSEFVRDQSIDKVIDGIQYYGYATDDVPTAWSEGKCWVTDENVTTNSQLYNEDGSAISYDGTIYSISNEEYESFTFNEGKLNDFSLEGEFCYDNTIMPWTGGLNRIVFKNDKTQSEYNCYSNSFSNDCSSNSFGNSCYRNSFGNNCYDNSFGDNCESNTFGNNCFGNSFGNECGGYSFGNNCGYNSFGNHCYSNSFGNYCDSNSFGNYCYSNSFSNDCSSNSFGDSFGSNSFGNYCFSNSFGDDCGSNSFGNHCYENSFGDSFGSNSFGNYCYDNSFGDDCGSNSFGNGCYNNSFGNSCSSNSFGNSCSSNSFGNYCDSNSLGEYCYYNSLGNGCSNNSFGNSCYRNSFGVSCSSNSFGNSCSSNSFGNYCDSNSLGEYCYYNSLGESRNNLKSYYRYIIFDNGNRYINLNCTTTTSSSKYFQNVRIGLGVNNTTTYKTINDSNVGQTYETLYKPANSQTITI